MLPQSIVIRNFRSIGNRGFELTNLNKINIIIGRNNSGKSNIIRAISMIKAILGGDKSIKNSDFDRLDYHNANEDTPFSFDIEISLPNSPITNSIAQQFKINTLKYTIEFSDSRPKIKSTTFSIPEDLDDQRDTPLDKQLWSEAQRHYQSLPSRMISPTDSEIIMNWNSAIEKSFNSYINNSIQEINIIPEFRQIKSGDNYDFNGDNLIETLARFKDPLPGHDDDILKFQKIESFTKNLLHLHPSATMSVTRDNSIIMIQNDNLRLPLTHYGTGVHQIVILLTAILSKSGEVFCIEEPEIHLHPQLQREFINFLLDNTDNKYIITTHSPTLINLKSHSSSDVSEKISTYFLNREGSSSFGKQIINDSEILGALNHMGVRASDILQTNSVIWVEGPSDRIYIRHWLGLINPDLKEGIDYQFAYYGGRVLAGFQVKRDSEEIDDLVNILRVNQNSVVVIDSDRKKDADRINSTKARIKRECETLRLHCWITHGREIENYIPPNILEQLYSLDDGSLDFKRFDKIEDKLQLAFMRSKIKGFDYSKRKTHYANQISKQMKKEDMSDELMRQISKIEKFIRNASRY